MKISIMKIIRLLIGL